MSVCPSRRLRRELRRLFRAHAALSVPSLVSVAIGLKKAKGKFVWVTGEEVTWKPGSAKETAKADHMSMMTSGKSGNWSFDGNDPRKASWFICEWD